MNDRNLSIHPRAWSGRAVHPKINTSEPSSRGKLERAMAGMKRHLEDNPRDEACKQRLSNLTARLNEMPKQRHQQAAE